MRVNQISSTELDLYPRRTSLLTRSRLHSYRKAIGPRNRVRDHGNTTEDNNRCKPSHMRDYGDQN
jgi:hypothetical protein